MLPVPSPRKGEGLVDRDSNPSTRKQIIAHRPHKAASEQDWFRDNDPCVKVNNLEEEECSAICYLEHKNI